MDSPFLSNLKKGTTERDGWFILLHKERRKERSQKEGIFGNSGGDLWKIGQCRKG